MSDHALEEGADLRLDFDHVAGLAQRGLRVVPVAVQNADTGDVILVAWASPEALTQTRRTRVATFYSASRDELWIKGQKSGNLFDVVEIRVNCEQNSLLYVVRPRAGGICHTRNASGEARDCYYRRLAWDEDRLENLAP